MPDCLDTRSHQNALYPGCYGIVPKVLDAGVRVAEVFSAKALGTVRTAALHDPVPVPVRILGDEELQFLLAQIWNRL